VGSRERMWACSADLCGKTYYVGLESAMEY